MKLITVEEHFESATVTAAIQAASGTTGAIPTMSPEMHHYMQTELPSPALMQDVTSERLAYMDQHGIDMQLLSYGNSSPQNLAPDVAIPLCKLANDELASVIAANPTRFAGLAVLPVGDPTAAAVELHHAVTKLGLKGVLLKGNYDNRFFDDPFFLPIFQAASDLDVPVYFHPSFIPASVTHHYYENDNWSDLTTGILSSAGFGWHMDVGIQVMRMIVSGLFDKFPNLKLVSGHWGEMVPMFLERLDDELTGHTPLKRSFADYYRKNVYVSPSGMLTKPQLDFMLAEMGPEHLLYAIDYPYKQPANVGTFLQTSGLSETTQELIAHGNAERIFKIRAK